MNAVTKIGPDGRKHKVIVDGDLEISVGPADEITDGLNLPPEFAVRLHNALFDRGILNYADASAHSRELLGVFQEALNVDVQRLMEAYYKYEHQEASNG